jgi:hypothetical protein
VIQGITHFNVRSQVSPWDPPVAAFPGWSDEEIAEEPPLYYKGPAQARKHGGPIARQLIEAVEHLIPRRARADAIVVVRSIKLNGYHFNRNPGVHYWHADFARTFSHPALARTYCLTTLLGIEFLEQPRVELPHLAAFAERSVRAIEAHNYELFTTVNEKIAAGVLTPRTTPVLQMVQFDCTELHRAVEAPEELWGRQRLFFRYTVIR